MTELKEQTLLPLWDNWVFCFNTKNYQSMPNGVRDSFIELLHNRNTIDFDNRNRLHNLYDDWLYEKAEAEVYKRQKWAVQKETYLFSKYLIFNDKTERQLHKKIRNEIFNIRVYDNYKEENSDIEYSSTDEED
jgi:hypothetical protein